MQVSACRLLILKLLVCSGACIICLQVRLQEVPPDTPAGRTSLTVSDAELELRCGKRSGAAVCPVQGCSTDLALCRLFIHCKYRDPDTSAPVYASCRLQQLERCVQASTAEAASLHEGLAGVAEYRAALDVASQQVRAVGGRWREARQRGTGCG